MYPSKCNAVGSAGSKTFKNPLPVKVFALLSIPT